MFEMHLALGWYYADNSCISRTDQILRDLISCGERVQYITCASIYKLDVCTTICMCGLLLYSLLHDMKGMDKITETPYNT